MNKSAKEYLEENYSGQDPVNNGNGWIDMEDGGSYYHEDNVIQAMEAYASQRPSNKDIVDMIHEAFKLGARYEYSGDHSRSVESAANIWINNNHPELRKP